MAAFGRIRTFEQPRYDSGIPCRVRCRCFSWFATIRLGRRVSRVHFGRIPYDRRSGRDCASDHGPRPDDVIEYLTSASMIAPSPIQTFGSDMHAL